MNLVSILSLFSIFSPSAHAFTYTYCDVNGWLLKCTQGCTAPAECVEIGRCRPSRDRDNEAPDSDGLSPFDLKNAKTCK